MGDRVRPRPLVRAAIGVVAIVVAYLIEPMAGVVMGGVALVWFLLGLGAVIHEHAEVAERELAHLPVVPPPAKTPRDAPIECPQCSLFVPTDAAACTCGWVVPEAA